MSVLFVSDTHFHHARIIEYCKRPFLDVGEMDETLVQNWNETVARGDEVYHLGDVALCPYPRLAELRPRLNGKIILILGNHDRNVNPMLRAGFDEAYRSTLIREQGVSLYLRHKPEFDTVQWCGADLHLCGHVHEAWLRKGNIINVGVDQWGFRPRRLEELMTALPTRSLL